MAKSINTKTLVNVAEPVKITSLTGSATLTKVFVFIDLAIC